MFVKLGMKGILPEVISSYIFKSLHSTIQIWQQWDYRICT